MATIKEEIKQKRAFESPEQEAIVALLLTTDQLKGRLSELAATYDITPQQYNVLRILNGAGPEGLPTLEVMQRMIERNPGITRLLDRIEIKQLITRERLESDRRCQICKITKKGSDLLKKMDRPMNKLSRDVMQHLDEDQIGTLVQLLKMVRNSM